VRFGAVFRDRSFEHHGPALHRRPGRRSPKDSSNEKFFDRPGRAPLMRFVSLQRSLVTPRCLGPPRLKGHPASTFAVPAVFSLCAGDSSSRRLCTAWPRQSTVSGASPSPPAAGHAPPLFFAGDVPLLADRAFVTSSDSSRRTAQPALDCLVGQTLHLQRADVSARPNRTSRSLGAGLKVPAHHQARVRGRRLGRRHSWDLDPSQV
jgi:hypothetical protein